MAISSGQFREQQALMQELGRHIARNRQLFPPPPHVQASSKGKPGVRKQFAGDPEGLTRRLKEKIESTKVSNQTAPAPPDAPWIQH